jgi:hypothetical protein
MRVLLLCLFCMSVFAVAAENSKNVRYKKGKRLDFESLLVEGENKKPELAVVTGNLGEKDLSLLKLKENFQDENAVDYGEEVVE